MVCFERKINENGGIMDLNKKFKSIEDIEKEIEKFDVLLGSLKGYLEDINKDADVYSEYAEVRAGLSQTISAIRRLRNALFRILGKRVYENEEG